VTEHSNVPWALEDRDFQELVAEFVAVIQRQNAKREIEPAVVNSALLYVNALFYEGSPYYQGKNRLDEAILLSQHESELMLRFLREMHQEIGMPVLFQMMLSGSAS
jgi:hypothetical protein